MKKLKSISSELLYYLIVQEPLISYFFMRSKIIESDDLPAVAGVNIKKGLVHLYLNPSKMERLTKQEKLGVLVHEYLHVLLLHCSTRLGGLDPNDSPGKQIKKNIAMDMAINQLIENSKYSLPDLAVRHNKEPFSFPACLTAEQYFDLLDKGHSDDEMQSMFGDWQFDDHSIWEEGSSLEKGTVIGELAKGYAKTKNGSDPGEVLRGAGNSYGSIIENLIAIESYEISWQTQARKFVQNLIDDKRRLTYKRPSRRYPFPSKGNTFKRKAKIAAIVDTSGSMSDKWLAHIGGQLNLMTKVMQIDVLWCDATVQGKVVRYKPSRDLECPGRGGTDMQPAFTQAAEEKYRGVICFTDGDLYRKTESNLPTLWVVVNNKSFEPPFGEVVHVEW